MGDIIKTEHNQLIGLLHSGNGLALGKPFERDIFLLETQIAGTSHVKGFSDLEPSLQEGDKVDLFREPDNKVDKHAVLIHDKDGNKLGYLPQKDNLIISRLMDGGKLIYGKIAWKKKRGNWVQVGVEVWMKD